MIFFWRGKNTKKMSSPTRPAAASAKENVKVVVRCRPLNQDERQRGVPELGTSSSNALARARARLRT